MVWRGGEQQPFETTVRVTARLFQVTIVESHLTAVRLPGSPVRGPEEAPSVAERWPTGPLVWARREFRPQVEQLFDEAPGNPPGRILATGEN